MRMRLTFWSYLLPNLTVERGATLRETSLDPSSADTGPSRPQGGLALTVSDDAPNTHRSPMRHAHRKPPRGAQSPIRHLLEQGIRNLEHGDHVAAERGFTEVLRREPHNAFALNGLGATAMMRANATEAVERFRAALAADPSLTMARENLAKALIVLAQQAAAVDDPLEAWFHLREAGSHVSGNPALRDTAAMEACALGKALVAIGRREAIDAVRLAISLAPNRIDARVDLDLFLSNFGEKALLSDYAPELTSQQLGRIFLIACFPKSGSTLLKRLLMATTGFAEGHLVSAYRENEQDIYLPNLRRRATHNQVVQQHCQPTAPNLHLLQAFGVRPIILVRDIFDVLLSWKEFLDIGAYQNTFYRAYAALPDAQRFDLVIDDRASWYISFFAGWQRAVESGQIVGLWLTYDELIAEPRRAVERICEFQGIAPNGPRLEQTIAEMKSGQGRTRFNKGISGRGRAAFSDAQIAQVRRVAAYHPDVDFTRIGL